MVLISAEACAFVLERPFLHHFEIRELIAFGASDYLVEKVALVEPIKYGHVAILHRACRQLDFFDFPEAFGEIPQWSSFFQVWG